MKRIGHSKILLEEYNEVSLPKMVVIEGIDGVGKTTLAHLLEERLGYIYLYTPQSPFADIREEIEKAKDINTRFFYYLASVVAIQPYLTAMISQGKRVVVDRYIYSTIAMHQVLGANVSAVTMEQLPIRWPDYGIHLTAIVSERIKRLSLRKKQIHDEHIERFTRKGESAVKIYQSFADLITYDTTTLSIEEVYTSVHKQLIKKEGIC